MGFQTTVRKVLAAGIPGELYSQGPVRAAPFTLVSTPNENKIGNAFTVSAEGVATVGGSGAFAGILGFPKSYAMRGTAGDSLAATLVLPDNAEGELVTMGEMYATINSAAAIGDKVVYDTTTGALSAVARQVQFTAAIAPQADLAVFTGTIDDGTPPGAGAVLTVTDVASGTIEVGQLITGTGIIPGTRISALGTGTGGTGTYTVSIAQEVGSITITAPDESDTSVMTVSAVAAGVLAVGQKISGTGVENDTYITALGTGTGGTGTYVVSNAQTVSSTAMTTDSVAGSGKAFVPNCEVSQFTLASPGLGMITLTN